jgi:hypothetical protein
MKHRVVRVILGFSAIALHLAAQTAAAPAAKPSYGTPATSTKPDAAKPAPATPGKEEEPPKIEGQEIKRGDRYLGIAVVNGTFKLTFYDAKKKPIPADVVRAVLRWPVKYQKADERTVLNPAGDGKSLTSGKVIKPPLLFKLYITLIPKDGSEDSATENYQIDFRG